MENGHVVFSYRKTSDGGFIQTITTKKAVSKKYTDKYTVIAFRKFPVEILFKADFYCSGGIWVDPVFLDQSFDFVFKRAQKFYKKHGVTFEYDLPEKPPIKVCDILAKQKGKVNPNFFVYAPLVNRKTPSVIFFTSKHEFGMLSCTNPNGSYRSSNYPMYDIDSISSICSDRVTLDQIRRGNFIIYHQGYLVHGSNVVEQFNVRYTQSRVFYIGIDRKGVSTTGNGISPIEGKVHLPKTYEIVKDTLVEVSYTLNTKALCAYSYAPNTKNNFNLQSNYGIEFECPVTEVKIRKEDFMDHYHYDGGGMEIKTHVIKESKRDQEFFRTPFEKVFSLFNTFAVSLRNDKKYTTNKRGSCHIHFSAEDLFRSCYRDLFINNYRAIFNEAYFGLYFFDIGHPLQRRNTTYGFSWVVSRKNGKFVVKKHSRVVDNTSFNFDNFGRGDVLRTIAVSEESGLLHFEYRGTDFTPSAILLGLKTELIKAMVMFSAEAAQKGEVFYIYSNRLRKLCRNIDALKHPTQLAHVIARKEAYRLIQKVKPFLSPQAYKGLNAWAKYMDIIDINVGTREWYEKLEKAVIDEMGINYITKISNSPNYVRELPDVAKIYSCYRDAEKEKTSQSSKSCCFCNVEVDSNCVKKFGGISICAACFKEEESNKQKVRFKNVEKQLSPRKEKRIQALIGEL